MLGDLDVFQNAHVVTGNGIAQQHLVFHRLVTTHPVFVGIGQLGNDVVALGPEFASIVLRYGDHIFRGQLG
ncbi:hypothetical protein D3C87_1194160 [compost metagenome]